MNLLRVPRSHFRILPDALLCTSSPTEAASAVSRRVRFDIPEEMPLTARAGQARHWIIAGLFRGLAAERRNLLRKPA